MRLPSRLNISPFIAAFIVLLHSAVSQAAADTFKDCDQCPEMVVISAGEFTMGSLESETRREGVPDAKAKQERPQHQVQIKRFALGKFEVTRGQYASFAQETSRGDGDGCLDWIKQGAKKQPQLSWRDPGYAQDDRHPVVCISFDDTRAYVEWLSKKTGKPYRLPSEAEWEFAARAGTTTARYWGDAPNEACVYENINDRTSVEVNNLSSSMAYHQCEHRFAQTAPVGSFRANGLDLHDMLGNVWEWTEDCFNESYAGAPVDGSAWAAGNCSRRVVRGGTWLFGIPRQARAAFRNFYVATIRDYTLGFRVAAALD